MVERSRALVIHGGGPRFESRSRHFFFTEEEEEFNLANLPLRRETGKDKESRDDDVIENEPTLAE